MYGAATHHLFHSALGKGIAANVLKVFLTVA